MTTVDADPMFIVFGASKKRCKNSRNKNVLQLNSDSNYKTKYLCLF